MIKGILSRLQEAASVVQMKGLMDWAARHASPDRFSEPAYFMDSLFEDIFEPGKLWADEAKKLYEKRNDTLTEFHKWDHPNEIVKSDADRISFMCWILTTARYKIDKTDLPEGKALKRECSTLYGKVYKTFYQNHQNTLHPRPGAKPTGLVKDEAEKILWGKVGAKFVNWFGRMVNLLVYARLLLINMNAKRAKYLEGQPRPMYGLDTIAAAAKSKISRQRAVSANPMG